MGEGEIGQAKAGSDGRRLDRMGQGWPAVKRAARASVALEPVLAGVLTPAPAAGPARAADEEGPSPGGYCE
jgi:hypothetical protein